MKKVVAAVVVLASAIVFCGDQGLIGQDKKVKGRLPPYYSSIVTEPQREAIYLIQAKYAQQLTALQQQINALEKQRDQDIENVLSPQQKQLLLKAQQDAAAKRKKAADDKIADKVAAIEAAKAPPMEVKKARGKKEKDKEKEQPKDQVK